MQKILGFVLLLSISTFAAEKKEKKDALRAMTSGNIKSVMIIDSKDRAKDYILAFDKLRGEVPPARIYFELEHQRPINNVISMELMENGTLMLFRISTPLGAQFKIVPIEEILEITHGFK